MLQPILFDAAADPLVRAVAAHLARHKGLTRSHTELYVRWMQEIRGFKASTISRRLSVVIGFYRTCAIDGIIPPSPAEHVRRPNVPPESPTLGLSHLQFEAMLATAKASTNINDFALVAMLGLLGLRIFETCGANIEDLGEEHGHRVLKVRGKGGKVVQTPLPPAVQRAVERAVDGPPDRSCAAHAEPGWTVTPPPDASALLRKRRV